MSGGLSQISFKNHLPLWLYSGGAIGVLTVIFNVLSIGKTGASLMTALGLLGQILTSLILEKTGAFEINKKRMSKTQILSLLIIMIGIGVML